MKWIGEGIKQLPKNLYGLKLQLSDNELGGGAKCLGEGVKYLPSQLRIFELQFWKNNLGESIKWIGEGDKQLPYKLQSLEMQLRENNLGENSENFKLIREGMMYFPQNLKSFLLDIKDK